MADDARVFAGLGIVNPDAEQVCIVGGLGADGDQQRLGVRTLAGGQGVDKVRLRSSHLSSFVNQTEQG